MNDLNARLAKAERLLKKARQFGMTADTGSILGLAIVLVSLFLKTHGAPFWTGVTIIWLSVAVQMYSIQLLRRIEHLLKDD